MTYMTIREAAEKWQISTHAVRYYLKEERVPGAILNGGEWKIPSNQDKPSRIDSVTPPHRFDAPLAHKLYMQKKNPKNFHGLYDHVQVYFTYCSCRLASNRLTLEQIQSIFSSGKVKVGFEALKVSDLIEASNHFDCINLIIDQCCEPLSQKFIKGLHAMLTAGTIDERQNRVVPGIYRTTSDQCRNRKFPPADTIVDTLTELIDDYEGIPDTQLSDILDFHVKFETLAPFADCNGRIGRLIMFKECLRHEIMPFIFDDKNRTGYLDGIRRWETRRRPLLLLTQDLQNKFNTQAEFQESLKQAARMKKK